MKELSAFQRDLLFVINGMDEPYGLGIKADLEAYRETTINPGQLYPNLNALVENGYLTKQQKDDRTNLYLPTDRVAARSPTGVRGKPNSATRRRRRRPRRDQPDSPSSAIRSVMFSTPAVASSGFLPPVMTIFPLPNSRMTTSGSSIR